MSVQFALESLSSLRGIRTQMPQSIVVAHSSADFIQDAAIAEYVRKVLGQSSSELWPMAASRGKERH